VHGQGIGGPGSASIDNRDRLYRGRGTGSAAAVVSRQGGPVAGGDDELWSVDGAPGLTIGIPRPVPAPVEDRWVVDGTAAAVTSTLRLWVAGLHGQIVRPPTEGVVAQFGAALLYRASSKIGVPGWDKVPVRFTAGSLPWTGRGASSRWSRSPTRAR